MSVKVIIPGALTTVQDAGRYGYQSSGIQTSGVMDHKAYEEANALVGNTGGEAVLEATLFGGMMEVTADTVAAVTGADMEPKVNNVPCGMNRPVLLRAGDTLSLDMAKSGCRSYIAFAGGVDVPVVLGSRSTNMKCRMGGYEGRPLQTGDAFETGLWGEEAAERYEEVRDRSFPAEAYTSPIEVRVIEGPQAEYFTEKGKETFYSARYTISDQSDRMGIPPGGGGDRECGRHGHHLRRHRLRGCPGPGQREAHRAPGGQADHRGIRQDCHGVLL